MGDMLGDAINNAITTFLSGLANQLLGHAMSMITDFLLKFSDVNQYINIKVFLRYSQAIAIVALATVVIWEVFKAQTGGVIRSNNNSFSVITGKTIVSALAIYFLPYFVLKILLPINEAIVKMITAVGKEYTLQEKVILSFQQLEKEGIVIVLGLLVLSIGFIILAIISAIRFVDIVLAIIISPLVAVSFVKGDDGLMNWVKEIFCVVFTQSVLVLLLQILIKIMVENQNLTGIILSLGCMSVMLKGPEVLQRYVYKTGVGSGMMSIASIATMKSTIGTFK